MLTKLLASLVARLLVRRTAIVFLQHAISDGIWPLQVASRPLLVKFRTSTVDNELVLLVVDMAEPGKFIDLRSYIFIVVVAIAVVHTPARFSLIQPHLLGMVEIGCSSKQKPGL